MLWSVNTPVSSHSWSLERSLSESGGLQSVSFRPQSHSLNSAFCLDSSLGTLYCILHTFFNGKWNNRLRPLVR